MTLLTRTTDFISGFDIELIETDKYIVRMSKVDATRNIDRVFQVELAGKVNAIGFYHRMLNLVLSGDCDMDKVHSNFMQCKKLGLM